MTGCTVSLCDLLGAVATSPHLEHQGGLFSSEGATEPFQPMLGNPASGRMASEPRLP